MNQTVRNSGNVLGLTRRMIQTKSPIFGLMVFSFRDKKFSDRRRGRDKFWLRNKDYESREREMLWFETAYLLKSFRETTAHGRDKVGEFIISGSLSQKEE